MRCEGREEKDEIAASLPPFASDFAKASTDKKASGDESQAVRRVFFDI
jgi:hypothetical protein